MHTAISKKLGKCDVDQLLFLNSRKACKGGADHDQVGMVALHAHLNLAIGNACFDRRFNSFRWPNDNSRGIAPVRWRGMIKEGILPVCARRRSPRMRLRTPRPENVMSVYYS